MAKRVTLIDEVAKVKSSSSLAQVFTPNIAVIGVGGAGVNALNNLINMSMSNVKFIVANTDVKSLDSSLCENKIRLGLEITKGLGAGSKPEVGHQAAEESAAEIRAALENVDLLFIVAGMGGGTGTGASGVIAKIAKDLNILTLGFVTKPFTFEGRQRAEYAETGIAELQEYIDSLVIISNQNLFKIINENTSMVEAFRIMDNVIYSGVKAIADLIVSNGMVNLDFNDIKFVLEKGGIAMVTSVEVAGADRVSKVTEGLINNPLIDNNINLLEASNILINITGGVNMTLFEVDKIVNGLRDKANKDTFINFGAIFDEKMSENIRVAIVATGIHQGKHHSKAALGSLGTNVQATPVPTTNFTPNTAALEGNHHDEPEAAEPAVTTSFNTSPIMAAASAAKAPEAVAAPQIQAIHPPAPNLYIDSGELGTTTVPPLKAVNDSPPAINSKVESNQGPAVSSKSTSLFNLIEKSPESNDEDDSQESINSLGNGKPKTKSSTSKSFFDLPPFLRQK